MISEKFGRSHLKNFEHEEKLECEVIWFDLFWLNVPMNLIEDILTWKGKVSGEVIEVLWYEIKLGCDLICIGLTSCAIELLETKWENLGEAIEVLWHETKLGCDLLWFDWLNGAWSEVWLLVAHFPAGITEGNEWGAGGREIGDLRAKRGALTVEWNVDEWNEWTAMGKEFGGWRVFLPWEQLAIWRAVRLLC